MHTGLSIGKRKKFAQKSGFPQEAAPARLQLFWQYILLHGIARDGAADEADVGAAAELEFCGEAVGEHQKQLRVGEQLHEARRLDGEELYLGVRQGGEGLLFADEPLYVDGDDAPVGEDELIAHGLERGDDLLAVDEKAVYIVAHGFDFNGAQIPHGVLIEIDGHKKTLLISLFYSIAHTRMQVKEKICVRCRMHNPRLKNTCFFV